jgi:hypothetical protein
VAPLYDAARAERVIRYHAPWNLTRWSSVNDADAKNLEICNRSLVAHHAPYYHALTDHAIRHHKPAHQGGMFQTVGTLVTLDLCYLTGYIR